MRELLSCVRARQNGTLDMILLKRNRPQPNEALMFCNAAASQLAIYLSSSIVMMMLGDDVD